VSQCLPPNRESAATLEAESGYTMETPEVSKFRQYILEASWSDAEDALTSLGVTDSDGLWVRTCFTCVLYVLRFRYQEAKFFIGQQKYLELLEAGKTTVALQVLRNELAPLNVAQDQLHFLSGYER
jgi:WD repeat-containing protein 26